MGCPRSSEGKEETGDRDRGAKRGRRPRAASSHRPALCAAARPYADVTYANDAVKGRHSKARWRSAAELASLHLSSSNGPSTGDQGRGLWIKGALQGPMKARSYSEPPPHAHRGYGVRGVPGGSPSNSGDSMCGGRPDTCMGGG